MRTPDGDVRPHYRAFADWLETTPSSRVEQKRKEADLLFHRLGITFAVSGEEAGTERLIPFDIIPRIIPADEWQVLAAGLRQRLRALNAFLRDIYHAQEILRAGLIPADLGVAAAHPVLTCALSTLRSGARGVLQLTAPERAPTFPKNL